MPKYRHKILRGNVKSEIESCLHVCCEKNSCGIQELNIQKDHIHMIVMLPPKISVSTLMGALKGWSAIRIFKKFPELKQKVYWGNHFWAKEVYINKLNDFYNIS